MARALEASRVLRFRKALFGSFSGLQRKNAFENACWVGRDVLEQRKYRPVCEAGLTRYEILGHHPSLRSFRLPPVGVRMREPRCGTKQEILFCMRRC